MNLNPVSAEKLREALGMGSTNFAFRKMNGDLRIARGTTNLDLIPNEKHPTGQGGRKRAIAYFDLDKQEWRAVSESQEIFLP